MDNQLQQFNADEFFKSKVLENLYNGTSAVVACQNAGIKLAQFYMWYKQDQIFRENVNLAKECRNEIIEDALYQQAARGNIQAIVFSLTNREPEKWKDIKDIKNSGYIGKNEEEALSLERKQKIHELVKDVIKKNVKSV